MCTYTMHIRIHWTTHRVDLHKFMNKKIFETDFYFHDEWWSQWNCHFISTNSVFGKTFESSFSFRILSEFWLFFKSSKNCGWKTCLQFSMRKNLHHNKKIRTRSTLNTFIRIYSREYVLSTFFILLTQHCEC